MYGSYGYPSQSAFAHLQPKLREGEGGVSYAEPIIGGLMAPALVWSKEVL